MPNGVPYAHRNVRPSSRPRALFVPEPRVYELSNKKRAPPARVAPSTAVLSAVALTSFLMGMLVASNLSAFTMPAVTVDALRVDEVGNGTVVGTEGVEPVVAGGEREESGKDGGGDGAGMGAERKSGKEGGGLRGEGTEGVNEVVMKEPEQKKVAGAVKANARSEEEYTQEMEEAEEEAAEEEKEAVAADEVIGEREPELIAKVGPVSGGISWNRSWPLSEADDATNLYPLASQLKFNDRTLLNYFHMHKTGGVSTKVEVMTLFNRHENRDKLKRDGKPFGIEETCYEVKSESTENESVEHMWRCDWGQIRKMSPEEIAGMDVVLGHQYWEDGCDAIFGKEHTVKHFSIFRHPLPRKLSFFYHFFVRNLKRDERDVSRDEVIRFLLAEDLPNDPAVRDAGPSYYAARLLSDGMTGFGNTHRYTINAEKENSVLSQIQHRLDKRFVFVGLQLQEAASQCMLQKTLQVFAHEHGVDNLIGTPRLAEERMRLNTGGYPWTAEKIWKVMTPEQREQYKEVERVDLRLYSRVTEKFKRDVKMFSCESHVQQDQFLEDVFE